MSIAYTGRWFRTSGAYKDLAEVMRSQADLVEVVAHLKQVVCVKG